MGTVDETVAMTYFGRPMARRRGKDPAKSWAAGIDHGCNYTEILLGIVYATRKEAIAAATLHIAGRRDSLRRRLEEEREQAQQSAP
jgi:hypothetical protein